MKTALVYDRVNKWGGAERVLLAFHKMFPDAPLYTSVYFQKKAFWAKVFPKIITSCLQNVPWMQDKHEVLAPLMPIAFELLDFSDYDLVISVTSESAKGIITKPSTKHICYCLTPTRYLWSHYDSYFRKRSFISLTRPVVSYLQKWDKIAAQRPDVIIAVSSAVQERILKYYKRKSVVIHPPVEIKRLRSEKNQKFLEISENKIKNYFLMVSRLVNYKKVDLAIEAFNKLGYELIIVGTGREENKLKKTADANIRFVNNLTEERLVSYYQNARALIFPQEEDFGLVSVEAQAAGTPVIAYKSGGALDTVIEGKTGVFFDKQNCDSLTSAIKRFEKLSFNKETLVNSAKKFTGKKFEEKFLKLINNVKG